MDTTKRVLFSNARTMISLDLARMFHSLGIEVYVVDSNKLHMCSFSKAVKKSILVPAPRFSPDKYIEAVIDIVEKEKIDLVIPIYEEIFYIAKAIDKFPKSCKVLSTSFDILEKLHNKWSFQEKSKNYGFKTPKTYLLKNSLDLHHLDFEFPFILKACYSRASQQIKIIKEEKDIAEIDFIESDQWVAQEFLVGKKYCTYSLCKDGEVNAHITYPLDYAIEDNSCLNFKSVKHDKIFEWVERFIKLENFSGQIGFDFIESEKQGLIAIECNPRATSGAHVLCLEKDLANVFFGEASDKTIFPTKNIVKQIAPGMLMYGWQSKSIFTFTKDFLAFKDIIFDKNDIYPFLTQPLLFLYYLFLSRKLKCNFPSMFTHDLDYNGFLE